MQQYFPILFQLFKVWCSTIGRDDLTEKGVQWIRRNYRVCDIHFDENSKFVSCHNRANLKVGSIPNLQLPGKNNRCNAIVVDRWSNK
mgnify:FL=1